MAFFLFAFVVSLGSSAFASCGGFMELHQADRIDATGSYVSIDGPPSDFDPSRPAPLSFRNDGSAEHRLIGISAATHGAGFRWTIPTIDEANRLMRLAGLKQELLSAVGMEVTKAGFEIPTEDYWRALAKRRIGVAVGPSGVNRKSSHDLDHCAGYMILALNDPEMWIRATDALDRTFRFLDGRFPEMTGHLLDENARWELERRDPRSSALLERAIESMEHLTLAFERLSAFITIAAAPKLREYWHYDAILDQTDRLDESLAQAGAR